jgi:Pentapeptide repeats (8 copies)/TIR domain
VWRVERAGLEDQLRTSLTAEIGDMDRDEAIKLLRGGEEGINEWNRRRQASERIPDLTRADLFKTNLVKADLFRANLMKADLTMANLTMADLRSASLIEANFTLANLTETDLGGTNLHRATLHRAILTLADLSWTDLTGAKLDGACLLRADLTRADLSMADLSMADLSAVKLSTAKLSGANLTGATCNETLFVDIDLSDARGLETVRHHGPSTIGTNTLFLSKGKIPDEFLRGCGLPDSLIDYLPSLIGSMAPIQFYSSFISYSAKDTPFAERLYTDLQSKGVRCWYAPEDLKIGE